MKLWRVTAECEFFMASEEEPSRREMEKAFREFSDSEPDCSCDHVTEIEDVPRMWRDSIPYGKRTPDDRTCEEVLLGTPEEREAAEEAESERIRNSPMPNQMELPLA